MKRNNTITNCVEAAKNAPSHLCVSDHEEAWVLFLKSGNRLTGMDMIAKGTVDRLAIDSRTILRQALLNDASSIILMHNHPSNNPTPSKEDIQFTSKLRDACSILDISLLDHIIIAEDSFFSFSEGKELNYQ